MTIRRTGATPARLALAEQVRRLRDEGVTHREIAARLGISRSYANDLDHDPDGTNARARKDSYRGSCVDCGGPTTANRCKDCARVLARKERKWTRETVIDAIQRFAAANGRPPLADEWIRADPVNGFPPRTAVYQNKKSDPWQPFVKWADAIEAAGFPRPRVGQYVRRPRRTAQPTRYMRTEIGVVQMRDYIVLELDEDGRWIQHGPVQSHSEALAIESFVESLGSLNGRAAHQFVAVSSARWIVRELQQVTSFKAVAASA